MIFGVDGILLNASKMHPIEPYRETLSQVLKASLLLPENLKLWGKTERQIYKAIAAHNEAEPTPDDYDEAVDLLPRLLMEKADPDNVDSPWGYEANKGAPRLIRSLTARADCRLALLTGNEMLATGIKMESAGMYPIFFESEIRGTTMPLGAFGGDSPDEPEQLLPILMRRYADWLEIPMHKIVKDDVGAIFSSPQEIQLVQQHDIASIGVAVGEYEIEALEDAEILFYNLEAINNVQACLYQTVRERPELAEQSVAPGIE